ncbi:MAG TPA: DNA cytosine methyltransferase [Desulfobacterales bacterium]|nr:DNA cytosine methyltransferase [Desulfobacterales bacterium]
MQLKYLSLFSGAGGGDLAFQHLLGHQCIGYCDNDDYCQRVIAQRIKDGLLDEAPIFGDIRTLTKEMLDYAVNLCYRSSKLLKENDNMAAKRKDYDLGVELYNSGLSIQNVADYYAVTRQAMWAILSRRGIKFRPQKRYGDDNHFFRGGITASDRAQNILEHAVEKKIIGKKTHCEKCQDTGTFADGRTKVQAHHADYNKPLKVKWLCQRCHHEWHKHNIAIERKEDKLETTDGYIDVVAAGFP